MEHILNHIELGGTVITAPEYSHENHGREFYRFILESCRLSGLTDRLQIMISRELAEQTGVTVGDFVRIGGQIRSFNSRQQTGPRLVISVYAETLEFSEGEQKNDVLLTGAVCKTPIFRKTPLGREICDVILAVNRPYHRTDYLPCIFWGRTARKAAGLPVGAALSVEGRMQSRQYIKVLDEHSEQRTAYEISVTNAEILRQ